MLISLAVIFVPQLFQLIAPTSWWRRLVALMPLPPAHRRTGPADNRSAS